MAVLTQRVELHGPPMYYTCDWDAARESVRDLAALDPALAITGHGQPMRGDALRAQLRAVARDFDQVARPAHGRYARRPAVTDMRGVVELPPPVPDATSIGIAATALTVGLLAGSVRRSR